MFSSLRARLWLSYAILILTALSIVAAVLALYLLRNPFSYRQEIERLKAVEVIITSNGDGQIGGDMRRALKNASRTFNVRLVQYSADGEILVDTAPKKQASIPFANSLIKRRANQVVRDINGAPWLYTLSRLSDETFLLVAAPRPRVPLLGFLKDEFLPPFLQGGAIALLLSLVVAYFIARWIADPLQDVVQVAGNMPSAEIRTVEVRGPQEVQALMRAFNAMVARVQSSRTSQRNFVANVSHELKTPLTSIQGFAQAILDGTADTPDSRKQAAEVIYNESGRMHRMVLDLLDLARLDAGTADLKMSPLSIPALLNAIAEKFAPLAAKAGVQVTVNAPGELPLLPGDGDRLAQVFINLVDNALKFTAEGGTILLAAEAVRGEMQISVSDTGTGIPPAALPYVFDRFYRADISRAAGKKHGTGLGLAIVLEIVQAHGGRISVRSQEGQGTTIVVNLPLARSSVTTAIRRK